MLNILSQIHIQWALGLLIACGVYYFKRVQTKEENERKQMQTAILHLTEKHFNLEQAINFLQAKDESTLEKISNLQGIISTLNKSFSDETHKLEVKMYKIRGEIIHTSEIFKKEQNAILAKLDSKIENIYTFLTKHEKTK